MNHCRHLALIALTLVSLLVYASEETAGQSRAGQGGLGIEEAIGLLGEPDIKKDENTYQWLASATVVEFDPTAAMPGISETPSMTTRPKTVAYKPVLKACEITLSIKEDRVTGATLSGPGCDEYKKGKTYQQLSSALWAGFR